jgi:lipopolysaccharide export system protein LptC
MRERRIAIWYPLILMLLLAALTFWLDRIVQPEPVKRDGSTRHDPDYIVKGFVITREGADGNPRYTLSAASMIHYPDDDSTHLEKPLFSGFSKGRAPLHIEADKGLISSNGEHAYFRGHVKVTREAYDGESELTIQTSYLHIIPDQDLAQTDKPVTIRDARTIVTAIGLELNNKTRVIKLLSRVKGRYEKSH